jgi:manganese/zinc/iron transport system permease protein
LNHEGRPEAATESRVEHLDENLCWPPEFAREVVARAERRGLVREQAGALELTDRGRGVARAALAG